MLSKNGEEIVFNIHTLARNQQAQRNYQNYIQVATEFFDWVFLTEQELERRQFEESRNQAAVQGEIEKINRSIK